MNFHMWAAGILALATFLSALAVVAVQHDSRKQFRQLQSLEHLRDELEIEWGRLELEQGSWTAHSRIESLADTRLEMKIPRMGDTVMVLR